MEGRFRTFFLKLSDRCKRGKSGFAFLFLHLFYANHFQQDREYACEALLFAGFFNRRKFLPAFFSRRKISRDRFSSVFPYSRKKTDAVTRRILYFSPRKFFPEFLDDAAFYSRHLHLAHADLFRHLALSHIAEIAKDNDFSVTFGERFDRCAKE